jgi:hypothetical protein
VAHAVAADEFADGALDAGADSVGGMGMSAPPVTPSSITSAASAGFSLKAGSADPATSGTV